MRTAQSHSRAVTLLISRICLLFLVVYPGRAPAEDRSFGLARIAQTRDQQEDLAGTYSGRASSKDAARRVFTLELAKDGSATFTTLYVGKDTVRERGHWSQSGDQLVLIFNPMGPNAPPGAVTFRYHRAALRPIHWDPSEWGEDGPPVFRRDPVQGDPAG